MESSFNFSYLTNGIYSLSGYSLVIIVFTLLTVFVLFARKKVNSYMNYRKKLIDASEDYERKRQCRNDLRYHFDWAIERGEPDSAKNIGQEIIKLDKELKELYQDYLYLKEKGFYPLKNL